MIVRDAQQRIESYLGRLRARLRGVGEHDAREFTEELRSHILDKVSADGEVTDARVVATLAALGSPEELASQYLTDVLLARAQSSRSPVWTLKGLFRWASLSIAGFFVLVGSIVGYFLGGAFLLCAILKPLHPRSAGLWAFRDLADDLTISLNLGFGNPPAGGRELLGMWMIPLGIIVGCGLIAITTQIALWCVTRFRRSAVLPRR
jgi:hypothetical protein